MILLDYSSTSIAAIMKMAFDSNVRIDSDLVKHSIINSIRARNMELKATYGKMFIICDTPSVKCWRYRVFPHYKATRKLRNATDDKIDWEMVYQCVDLVRDALIEFFPYPVISVPGCEADDIIGHTALHTTEPTVIVGGDKDYFQTHSKLVKQYAPIKKQMLCYSDPHIQLKELIIRGDKSDGIPNFRSDDNVFITPGVRQRPIATDKLTEWLADDTNSFLAEEIIPEKKKKDKVTGITTIIPEVRIDLKKNFERNRTLIDFRCIPDDLKKMIETSMTVYDVHGNKSTVFEFLGKHRMVVLMSKINEFF